MEKEQFNKFKQEKKKNIFEKHDSAKDALKMFITESNLIDIETLVAAVVLIQESVIIPDYKVQLEKYGFINDGVITEDGLSKAKDEIIKPENIERLKKLV